jgi:hypothetical protein
MLTQEPVLAASDLLNCEAILRSGVFDSEKTSDYRIVKNKTQKAMCKGKTYNEGANAEFDYKMTGGSASWNKSEAESYCEEASSDYLYGKDLAISRSKASEVLANAWTKCIEAQSSSFFVYHYVQPKDAKAESYTYTIKLNRPSDTDHTSKVVTWTPKNAKCKSNGESVTKLTNREITPNGIVLSCTRDPKETTSFDLSVSQGGSRLNSVTLPALPDNPCDKADSQKFGFQPACVLIDLNSSLPSGYNQKITATNTCNNPMNVTIFAQTQGGPRINPKTLKSGEGLESLTKDATGQYTWVAIPEGCKVRAPQVDYRDGGTYLR